MPEFSSRKITNHNFHDDKYKGNPDTGCDTILGRDLMVQLGLMAGFKRQVLQWDGATVHMKKYSSLLEKYNLTKREMRNLVMQTSEKASTREATDRMVKILDITYAEADLTQADNNATHMNAEERTLLLSLIEDFEDLFEGDWSAKTVNLYLNPDSKLFNSRYYPVPIINKENYERILNA